MKYEKLWPKLDNLILQLKWKDGMGKLNPRGILEEILQKSFTWVAFLPDEKSHVELGLQFGNVILGMYKYSSPVIYWTDEVTYYRPIRKREFSDVLSGREKQW